MTSLLSLAFCTLLACVPALSAAAAAAAEQTAVPSTPSTSETPGETLAVDTPRTTADGNAFVAPAGWLIRTTGPMVLLTAPEGGSHIALVDVGPARDAEAAVDAAWANYDPTRKRTLALASDRPVRGGWEQMRVHQYETPASQSRTVSAGARRRGDRWTVSLIDMADAVASTRESQLELLFGSLMPKGYRRETFAGRSAQPLDAERIDALEQFIENARQQFDVPGVAVGIVVRDKVVLAQGFGVRALGKPDKVDADTLFMAASVTKPLTTLMLAKLVDAGTFTWDTPVMQVMPRFKLGDAETTRRVLIKHLVCACTGLPRQDMEWIFEGERMTPAAVVATVATMRPTSQFGELYQYSNLMAGTGGYVGGNALHPDLELGAAYDAAMQTLVFDPLAMSSTTFDFARAQRGNHAAPHGRDARGKVVPADMDINYSAIPSRPDGGAWSSVNDLLRYVRMELRNGLLPDGERYIGEAPLLQRRVPQVVMENNMDYGMGLRVDRTTGALLLRHGGVAFGHVAEVLWLPDHDVGAVLLTNADASGGGAQLRNLFRRRLLEVLFDGNPEALANVPVEARLMKEDIATERRRLTVPADRVAADQLATRYRSAQLGDIAVRRKGASVWFDVGGWKSEVATRRDNDGTIVFVTVAPTASGYEFAVADKPGERSLILRDDQHEYVFAKTK